MSNHTNTRRSFLKKSALATAFAGSTLAQHSFASNLAPNQPTLKIAPFRFDVTPPPGQHLRGGWITPVKAVCDRLIAEHPELQKWRELTRFGVNLQFVEPDTILQNGDEVVLIPPVNGG